MKSIIFSVKFVPVLPSACYDCLICVTQVKVRDFKCPTIGALLYRQHGIKHLPAWFRLLLVFALSRCYTLQRSESLIDGRTENLPISEN